jgi:hypothetical protein
MKAKIISFAAALLALAALNDIPAMECGMCAHVGRGGYWRRAKTFAKVKEAGCDWIRTDFDWWQMERKKGVWNFEKYDTLLEDAEKAGVKILPILYSPPKWCEPIKDHIPEWEDYIRRVMTRWGKKLPYVEIWNEPFHPHSHNMGAERFSVLMKSAYKVIKEVSPDTKVLIGECSARQLEEMYSFGARNWFDVMNVHLYTARQVAIPEGAFDRTLKKVRECMEKHGDGAKPIWVTETGWPTVPARRVAEILKAGLKVAEPSRKTWRVVHTDNYKSEAHMDDGMQDLLEQAFPAGSTYEACFTSNITERLSRGDVDALVLSFEEACPVEALEPALEFVRKGGTLVDFGGFPVYAKVHNHPEWWRKFHVSPRAWWMNNKYPKSMIVHSACSELPGPKSGYKSQRFLTAENCVGGDELIPLVAGKTTNDFPCVAAAVYKFNSDLKGRAIISAMIDHAHVTSSEARQARFVARTLAIMKACGVEKVFWYEQRSNERGGIYHYEGACHFGLLKGNYDLKKGFTAYQTFVKMCPPGSKVVQGKWCDEKDGFYRLQWIRPDGVKCGIAWKIGKSGIYDLQPGKNVKFFDYLGNNIARPQGSANGLLLTTEPIYWQE